MAKNTNKIIAGALGVVGLILILKYFKGKKSEPTPSPEPTPEPTPTPSAKDNFPLKKGSKGARVSQVQSLLLKIDKNLLPKFGVDGDFGSETEAAVLKVLGKKTVDNQADVDRLNFIYNKKTFPYVTPNEDIKSPIIKNTGIIPPFMRGF